MKPWDQTARDNRITRGKTLAGFAPIGPCNVTADEVPDIRVRCDVSGQGRQDDTAANRVCSLSRMAAFPGHVMPLEPGDVMATGVTAGPRLFMKPPTFLPAGDTVEASADGIGTPRTHVIAP